MINFIWCVFKDSINGFASGNLRKGFPGGSDGKESACNAGDPSSIPGLGRSAREGNGNPLSILAWRISSTEEPGRLLFMGSQRVGHDRATNTHTNTHTHTSLKTSQLKCFLIHVWQISYYIYSYNKKGTIYALIKTAWLR